MRKEQVNKKEKLLKYIGVVLWLVIAFLGVSLISNVSRLRNIRKSMAQSVQGLQVMREKNSRLEQDIAGVESGAYIERQVRDRLGLAKKGEIVLVLPDDEVLKKLSPRMSKEHVRDMQDVVNWQKWLDLFF